jgi:hypothetical protein
MNSYIVYGDEEFCNDKDNMCIIIEMAKMSIFRKEEPIMFGNNIEGALLLHMALQNMKGVLIK